MGITRLQCKKLHSAVLGRRAYLKILRNNHIKMLQRDIQIIIMPTLDWEVNHNGLRYLDELLLRRNLSHAIVITIDHRVKQEAGKYSNRIVNTVFCTSAEMEQILALYQLHPFDKRVIFVSLDKPEGRNASRLIGVKGTTVEELVAIGIYGLIPFRQASDALRNQFQKQRKPWNGYPLSVRRVNFLLLLALYFPFGIAIFLFSAIFHRAGKKVLNKRDKNNGPNEQDGPFFICPYPGTGDVYLALALLKDYAIEQQWNELSIGVIGMANKKICKLFGWGNVAAFSIKQMDSLVRFTTFIGWQELNIMILHHDAITMTTGIMDQMRNINGLDFYDLYASGVYGQKERKNVTHPELSYKENELIQLFKKYHLKSGKTVVLAPYSYTLGLIPDWVWVHIAENLKQKGYEVCTNCGSETEEPIEGTKRIFFPFALAVPFLEKAGYFIGTRSGFCDIISSAKCKKIIFYQGNLHWGDGTCMDFFSLNRMGMCNDAIEFEYQGYDFYHIINEIERHMEG